MSYFLKVATTTVGILYMLNLIFYCVYDSLYFADSSINIAVVSDPPGTPVNGLSNTFDYPVLTSVRLLCNATSTTDGSPYSASYNWQSISCYTHSNGVQRPCFYNGYPSGYSIDSNDLLAQDAGVVSCNANGVHGYYTSGSFTLRISGEQL